VCHAAKVSLEVYSNTVFDYQEAYGYDITKAYTACLEQLEDYPIFEITDDVCEGKPPSTGEGYVYLQAFSDDVRDIIHQCLPHWMPLNLYRALVELGFEGQMEVTHHYVASIKADMEPIRTAIDHIYDKCPEGAKLITNAFLGCSLNDSRGGQDEVALCSTQEELLHYSDDNRTSTTFKLATGQSLLSIHGAKFRVYRHARPLAHYVYAQHLLNTYALRKAIESTGAEILGCKTDCLVVDRIIPGLGDANPGRGGIKLPEKMAFKTTPQLKFKPWIINIRPDQDPNRLGFDQSWYVNKFPSEPIPTTQEVQLEQLLSENATDINRLILAFGGHGKSHMLKELTSELKSEGKNVHTFAPLRGQAKLVDGFTFHSGIGISVDTGDSQADRAKAKIQDGDWLLLDELSMMGKSSLTRLLEIKRQFKACKFIGFWGKGQLPPPDGHDYLYSDAVAELFDHQLFELTKNYRTSAPEFDAAIQTDPVAYIEGLAAGKRHPHGIAFTNRRCADENIKRTIRECNSRDIRLLSRCLPIWYSLRICLEVWLMLTRECTIPAFRQTVSMPSLQKTMKHSS
jgi:hypothetical protein